MPILERKSRSLPEAQQNPNLTKLFHAKESRIHGEGLFARIKIHADQYLGSYDGRTTHENGMHVLWVQEASGEWIGRDGENLLRYINHATSPNAEFDGFDLYALRAIEPGEEITIDYGDEFDADVSTAD
jgi:SET domain-containing protein